MDHERDPTGAGASVASPGSDSFERGRLLDRPSLDVVSAVVDATDRDPIALAPLSDHVDADTLDALLTAGDASAGDCVLVSFRYEGFRVAVDSETGVDLTRETDAEER